MLFPDNQHHHTSCLTSARKRLGKRAQLKSKKLGVNDKLVFDILLSEHRAFSAYEVVNRAAQKNKRLQAIQVYRAINTLVDLGVAHRVELKNGYMACHSDEICTAKQILICSSCNQVAELELSNLDAAVTKSVRDTGFVPLPQKLELQGFCPNCAST